MPEYEIARPQAYYVSRHTPTADPPYSWQKVKATPVTIPGHPGDYFAHKGDRFCCAVSEATTGTMIAQAGLGDLEGAIANAKATLDLATKNDPAIMAKTIAQRIATSGLSPRYGVADPNRKPKRPSRPGTAPRAKTAMTPSEEQDLATWLKTIFPSLPAKTPKLWADKAPATGFNTLPSFEPCRQWLMPPHWDRAIGPRTIRVFSQPQANNLYRLLTGDVLANLPADPRYRATPYRGPANPFPAEDWADKAMMIYGHPAVAAAKLQAQLDWLAEQPEEVKRHADYWGGQRVLECLRLRAEAKQRRYSFYGKRLDETEHYDIARALDRLGYTGPNREAPSPDNTPAREPASCAA